MLFCITRGNVDDRQPLDKLFKRLKGLAAGDKGYVSKKHEEQLAKQGLRLITKVRRNMKKRILSAFEKYFLSHRGLVETIIDQLKAICQIERGCPSILGIVSQIILWLIVSWPCRLCRKTQKTPVKI
jgi:hypothetical protein